MINVASDATVRSELEQQPVDGETLLKGARAHRGNRNNAKAWREARPTGKGRRHALVELRTIAHELASPRWADVVGVRRSKAGNQGGVYFLEDRGGTSIAVKPNAYWMDAFSLKLAGAAGIGAPDTEYIEHDAKAMKHLRRFRAGKNLLETIEAGRFAYGTRILVMESVKSKDLGSLGADAAAMLSGEEGRSRLHQIGAIGAFDIMSRNADRFGIWYAVPMTNSGNLLFATDSTRVVGVDQGFLLPDPARQQEMLRFIKEKLDETTHYSELIRTQIRETTGHDIGPDGARAIDDGFRDGIQKIGALDIEQIKEIAAAVGQVLSDHQVRYLTAVLELFRNQWPNEVREVLWKIRDAAITHSTRVNGPPAGLSACGFDPELTLGGGSGMAYLTRDRRHVIKMYSTPGIAHYEYWVTKFFEEQRIPVPEIVHFSEQTIGGRKMYVTVKKHAEGFLPVELKHPEVAKLGLMPWAKVGDSMKAFAQRVFATHGPQFGEFLARNGVDPNIFDHSMKAQFLENPGDLDGSRIWDNILLTPRGWVLFDP